MHVSHVSLNIFDKVNKDYIIQHFQDNDELKVKVYPTKILIFIKPTFIKIYFQLFNGPTYFPILNLP